MSFRVNQDSPYQVEGLRLILRGGHYYIHGAHGGERIRRATGTTSLAQAKAALDAVIREFDSGWRDGHNDAELPWKAVAKGLHARHRAQAKYRHIPFSITGGDVFETMQQAGFVCAVSGIAYSRRIVADGPSDPWSPSIDRIENRHGYLRDNIRVVCLAANIAMNRWGFDVLLRLSKAVASRGHVSENVTQTALSPPQDTAQIVNITRKSDAA